MTSSLVAPALSISAFVCLTFETLIVGYEMFIVIQARVMSAPALSYQSMYDKLLKHCNDLLISSTAQA